MVRAEKVRVVAAAVGLAVGLLAVVGLSSGLLAQEQPTEPTAEEVVEKMAQAFGAIKTLEASGTTVVDQQFGDEKRNVELTFALRVRRADGLYFKTQRGPYGFEVVWDGGTGWMVAAHENQYQKHAGLPGLPEFLAQVFVATDLAGFPLSYAQNLLAEDPKVAILAGVQKPELTSTADTYTVTLNQPRGEVVKLTVGKDDFLVRKLFVDLAPVIRKRAAEQGRQVPAGLQFTVTVNFAQSKVNQALSDETFVFTVPQGAQLVSQFGPQPMTGKLAPDFTLQSLAGKSVTLSQLRGGVVVLEFWATWCPACRVAMPRLEKLYQEFADKGLTVLGVSTEDKATVETFVKAQNITFTNLVDPNRITDKAYRVESIPRTLIIDREGKVYADFTGLQPEGVLRGKLAELGIK